MKFISFQICQQVLTLFATFHQEGECLSCFHVLSQHLHDSGVAVLQAPLWANVMEKSAQYTLTLAHTVPHTHTFLPHNLHSHNSLHYCIKALHFH